MSAPEVGDRLAADLEALDPLTASDWGALTNKLPAFDPEWFAARAQLFRDAVRDVSDAPDDVDAAVLRERAAAEIGWVESGEAFCELQAALDSPLFRIRHCFENMPRASADDWRAVADRLAQVPAALAGFTRAIDKGRRDGPRAAASQVEATAAAAARWDFRELV